MKKFILIIFLLSVVSYAKETCYTVQIVSVKNTSKNYNEVKSKKYDDFCKVMVIGQNVTVRCGCYDRYKDAKKHLPRLKSLYKDSYITSTYKYRFETQNNNPTLQNKTENKSKISTDLNNTKKETIKVTLVDKNTTTKKDLQITIKDKNTTKIVAIDTNTTKRQQDKNTTETITLNENNISQNINEDINKTQPIIITHKKIKKKKKKKKKKYVKRKPQRYKYQRYLAKFQNQRGIGWYDFRYKFGAQLSYDVAYVDEAQKGYFDRGWRRVRVYTEGSFFKEKLFYELEYSFTGNNNYKNIYIGYQDKFKPLNLKYRAKFGNIKIPFSLEGYTTSKNNTFMERALNDGYSDRRKVGGEILLREKIDNHNINLFFDIFSNSIDEREDKETDHPGYSTRLTYAYKADKYKIFEVGTSILSQNRNGDNVKYNQAAESDFIYEKYVSVKIKDVNTIFNNNIEALLVYDKFSLQGEYTKVKVDAKKGIYNFNGYYLQGSYFLVGKGRRFKVSTSTFGKIRPNKGGAIELAARYSYINLNDKDEHGGEQTDYNFGINWYINSEFKLMFNYVMAYPKDTDDYDGMLQIFQARMLFAF
jgi:phosphate-selective porin OprO/OprP